MCDVIMLFCTSLPVRPPIHYILYYGRSWKVLCFYSRSLSPNSGQLFQISPSEGHFDSAISLNIHCVFIVTVLGKAETAKLTGDQVLLSALLWHFGILWSSSSALPMIHISTYYTRRANHKTYCFIGVAIICLCKPKCVI